MSEIIKKELKLESLHCTDCTFRLRDQINKIEKVLQTTVDYKTGTLTIEISDDADISRIFTHVDNIIKELKHEDEITEKKVTAIPGKKVLILKGLNCPNCGAKIEKAIRNINGVKYASFDFITKKLILETQHKKDLNKIIAEASKLAMQIESGIEIISDEIPKKTEEPIDKSKIIRLGTGTVLFITGIIFNFAFYIELGIFLTSYLLIGGEILISAIKNIIKGQVFDENLLMSIATIGAFAIKEFPEGVAVMLFYQIGEIIQDLAVNRSRSSIAALMDIRPDYANLKVGDTSQKVSPDQVKTGESIIIKPGEKVPLDGKVILGTSALDTSAITGESVPQKVGPGSVILSGTINKNGILTVEVTNSFKESTVSKILDLVENASAKKAPTEKFITKFARYYTPIIVFSALALAIIPPIIIPGATFATWIYRALVFLVVSCPCALVISIPLGFFGGIGKASKSGILIKGSNYLEALNDIDTIVFDKTGTLTEGVFTVTEIRSTDNIDATKLLEIAAHAENYSTHPIAQSILKEYGEVNNNSIEEYDEIAGYGVKVRFKGQTVLAGNAKLMQKEGISFSEAENLGTTVYISVDGEYAGYIVISDKIKEDSKTTISGLKKIGVKKLVMLTGDNKYVGEKIGNILEFDEIYTELLPNQKVEKLEILEKEKQSQGKLIFVGDGINDAPVLTRADIGIAMGGLGSDAAIEAADIVIMTDEPSKIIDAIKISKKTKTIVWQNIIFAFAIKGAILLLGAFGIATMWEAVFADVGVALIAIINALRILNSKKI